MRLRVQWAQTAPADYEVIDHLDWPALPARMPNPAGQALSLSQLGGAPGWIASLKCQGVVFSNDHLAVEPIPGGGDGVIITAWDDETVGRRQAQRWTIPPLAKDPRIGGGLNTRHWRIVYADNPGVYASWAALLPIDGTELREWPEFEQTVMPTVLPIARNGVLMTNQAWSRHLTARNVARSDWKADG